MAWIMHLYFYASSTLNEGRLISMPLYEFHCERCNRRWEAYRRPDNMYSEYCCGVEARLVADAPPKPTALECYTAETEAS